MDIEPLEKSFPGTHGDSYTENRHNIHGSSVEFEQGNHDMKPPSHNLGNASSRPLELHVSVGLQPYPAGASSSARFYPQQHTHAVVVQPGVSLQMIPQEEYAEVPDYMCLSGLSACFCLCIGIASIVYAGKALTLKTKGQYQTALTKAKTAKNLALYAIVFGIIIIILNIILHVKSNRQY